MRETSITRRRVVKGVGAIGVVGATGSSVVSAQETETPADGGGETAALRAVHASPDAPNVDVILRRADGGAAETPTDTETPTENGGQTEAALRIQGLEFGQVSSYNEVQPGTYQMQIVPAEQGLLGGLLEGIFGGGGDDQTVLLEQQVEVQAGTTYTAVAFGEASQGRATVETETPGAETPETETPETETPGGGGQAGQQVVQSLNYGEFQSFTLDAGDYTFLISEAGGGATETPTATETPGGQTGGGNRGFQAQVIEDDLSDPGEGTDRMLVFNAVPDANVISIRAVSDEAVAEGDGDTPEAQTETPMNGASGQVRTVQVSLEGGATYSGFAMGYLNPQAAETETPETPTDGEDGGGQGERPEFEFVTVQNSQGGERSDGGTGGGLLGLSAESAD